MYKVFLVGLSFVILTVSSLTLHAENNHKKEVEGRPGNTLLLNNFKVEVGPLMFGLAGGYELVTGLHNGQEDNLFVRLSLAKELLTVPFFRSDKLYLGFEAAARSGYYGPLDISNEIQEIIGGPTPVVSSSPEVEFLATIRKNIFNTRGYLVTKLGAEFSILKFDRYDLSSSKATTLLGYVGLGFKFNTNNDIYILVSDAKPFSKVCFANIYCITDPYTNPGVLLGFAKSF